MTTAVTIAGVCKTFASPSAGDPLRVLDNFDLTIPTGQFTCIVGPSGCGKTTLLRLVAGLGKPDAGEIIVGGTRIQAPGQDTGFVFQRYGLLPWRTVLGNVEFGLEIRHVSKTERRQKAMDILKRLGLAGFESYFPSQISGGMQQRVALGRALVKDPRVLLMDEPFAAVDLQTREELQGELLSVWETIGTTVIFVTHSIDEAVFLGDRVLVMAGPPGRCVGDISVPLPRPRTHSDARTLPEFGQTTAEVRKLLSDASAAVAARRRQGEDRAGE